MILATRPGGHWVLLVVGRLIADNCLVCILECQKQLLGIEFFRTPTELRTLRPVSARQNTRYVRI
jgi:hypothetical protein